MRGLNTFVFFKTKQKKVFRNLNDILFSYKVVENQQSEDIQSTSTDMYDNNY